MESNIKFFSRKLNIFWVFLVASFLGVIVEIIWCYLKYNIIESRTSLIFIPLNPVYGLGAVLITLVLTKIKTKNNIKIFIYCMLIGGIFEYCCSLFQEVVFKSISWSYPKELLGIFERTSLLYSIFWGLLGLMWIKLIYPLLDKYLNKIKINIYKIITYILMSVIIIDILFTSFALFRQLERRKGIDSNNTIDKFYDTYFDDVTLKKLYPNMKLKNLSH